MLTILPATGQGNPSRSGCSSEPKSREHAGARVRGTGDLRDGDSRSPTGKRGIRPPARPPTSAVSERDRPESAARSGAVSDCVGARRPVRAGDALCLAHGADHRELFRQARTRTGGEGQGDWTGDHLLPVDHRGLHGGWSALLLLLLGVLAANAGEQSLAESGGRGLVPGVWTQSAGIVRAATAELSAERLRARAKVEAV